MKRSQVNHIDKGWLLKTTPGLLSLFPWPLGWAGLIRRLRKKLEEDSNHPQLVLTKANIGYFLANPS